LSALDRLSSQATVKPQACPRPSTCASARRSPRSGFCASRSLTRLACRRGLRPGSGLRVPASAVRVFTTPTGAARRRLADNKAAIAEGRRARARHVRLVSAAGPAAAVARLLAGAWNCPDASRSRRRMGAAERCTRCSPRPCVITRWARPSTWPAVPATPSAWVDTTPLVERRCARHRARRGSRDRRSGATGYAAAPTLLGVANVGEGTSTSTVTRGRRRGTAGTLSGDLHGHLSAPPRDRRQPSGSRFPVF